MKNLGLFSVYFTLTLLTACGGKSLNADDDLDGDSIANHEDNCPTAKNASQYDEDDDGIGDACDIDSLVINDVPPVVDIPPIEIPLITVDVSDADDDGFETELDNCPTDWNPDQADLDMDGQGDVCDEDDDGDSWFDAVDNCVNDYNPLQEDADDDGYGDVCDDSYDIEQCPTELPLQECDNGYGWATCDEQSIEYIPRGVVIQGGSGTALYWYAEDGTRYVFPNQTTFDSWFQPGFSCPMIFQVSDADLATILIAGTMTIRPGTHLIKITTDPAVYAVTCGGVIRRFESETVIAEIYGPDWNTYIVDVADAFFVDYTVGEPITSTADFDPFDVFEAIHWPEDDLACRN